MFALPGWIGGAILLAAMSSFVALAVLMRAVQRMQARHQGLTADLAAALREMERLAAICGKLGAQAGRIERTSRHLAERLEIMELRPESRPFDRAIDSARQGADPVRLERQFGLSQTEAGLVTLLHGVRGRISDSPPSQSRSEIR